MDVDLAAAVQGAIGDALLGLRSALAKWIEGVVRERGVTDLDAFVASVRKAPAETFASLDLIGLLDVILAPDGWVFFSSTLEGHVRAPLFDVRDVRALFFDLRRHRNAHAHHRITTLRAAYRALDCVAQLLEVVAGRVLVEVEKNSVAHSLDEVILVMANRVVAQRNHGHADIEADGDIAMHYADDE